MTARPHGRNGVVWKSREGLKKDAAFRRRPDRRHRQPHADAGLGPQGDDFYTVDLTTKEPDSFLPINLSNLFMASRRTGRRSLDALASV